MQGIINVYKQQNYTSHDCVAIIRRVTGEKKVGHTGTLDPMATGVLPVCIGKATRIIEYMDDAVKEYNCTMKLGTVTDTLDIWGSVIKEDDHVAVNDEQVEEALKSFIGDIEQVPPKYSALKVKGKKLYEYAREGKEVEIKPRTVQIESIIVNYIKDIYVNFTVRCSKGTYVRTLCDDIGKILGTGACMTYLERTENSPFRVENSIDIERIKDMTKAEIQVFLMAPDFPLTFPELHISREKAIDLAQGKVIEMDHTSDGRYRVYSEDEFIGVADCTDFKLHAHKIINTDVL